MDVDGCRAQPRKSKESSIDDVFVERNHVNQKKAQSMMPPPTWGHCFKQRGRVRMDFYRLTPAFYLDYGNRFPEILQKQTRPYYIVLLLVMGNTFAIPLRSHIPSHNFCYIADGCNSGLDFTKAVVITDTICYIDPYAVTIRQNEFDVMKKDEYEITQRFESFVKKYKKQIQRVRKNPSIPLARWCTFSSLQYFHKELGI